MEARMATPEKEATGKAATPTPSPGSNPVRPKLRPDAPQLRTADKMTEKHEQIFDALEHDRITGKIAEQMGQQLKGILGIAKLELQYLNLARQFGRKVPVPRSPIIRSVIGLPEKIATTDGDFVRRLLPEG